VEMLLVEKYRKEAEALRTQLAKANEKIENLNLAFIERKALCRQAFDANEKLSKELAKANERVDGLEKALANCADALYESDINHKKAINKIQAECIDVLFDFAAKRDDSGFAIALYEQPYEIQDAIRTFKQLSKDQSNG